MKKESDVLKLNFLPVKNRETGKHALTGPGFRLTTFSLVALVLAGCVTTTDKKKPNLDKKSSVSILSSTSPPNTPRKSSQIKPPQILPSATPKQPQKKNGNNRKFISHWDEVKKTRAVEVADVLQSYTGLGLLEKINETMQVNVNVFPDIFNAVISEFFTFAIKNHDIIPQSTYNDFESTWDNLQMELKDLAQIEAEIKKIEAEEEFVFIPQDPPQKYSCNSLTNLSRNSQPSAQGQYPCFYQKEPVDPNVRKNINKLKKRKIKTKLTIDLLRLKLLVEAKKIFKIIGENKKTA